MCVFSVFFCGVKKTVIGVAVASDHGSVLHYTIQNVTPQVVGTIAHVRLSRLALTTRSVHPSFRTCSSGWCHWRRAVLARARAHGVHSDGDRAQRSTASFLPPSGRRCIVETHCQGDRAHYIGWSASVPRVTAVGIRLTRSAPRPPPIGGAAGAREDAWA